MENFSCFSKSCSFQVSKGIKDHLWNTRLEKTADGVLQIKIASINKEEKAVEDFNGSKCQIVYGDYSDLLKVMNHHLAEATKYVADDNQKTMYIIFKKCKSYVCVTSGE